MSRALAQIEATKNFFLSLLSLFQVLSEARCLHTLTELNLSRCVDITDQGLELLLSSSPPLLTILAVHKCPKVTNLGSEAMLQFFSERADGLKQLSWTIT